MEEEKFICSCCEEEIKDSTKSFCPICGRSMCEPCRLNGICKCQINEDGIIDLKLDWLDFENGKF